MSKLSRLEKTLNRATNYQEWAVAAQALDEFEGKDKWRLEPESEDYDYRLLASRVRLFRKLRRQNDYDQIVFRLREELHGNIGNMANPALYQHARSGTKNLVQEYLDEVTASLNLLCDSTVKTLPPMRKRRFMKRAARSFGRSALLLSGGASLGLFHLGVIEELKAEGVLPRVITGSSAGSIIAGVLATHTDTELDQIFEPGRIDFEWSRMFGLYDMLKGEGVLDQKLLQRSIDKNIPEMTFLEAYKHTYRILNISVSPSDSHQFPRLLNYLTAPNVLIRRAALASTAIPGLFPPVQLRAKNFAGKSVAYMPQSRWIDGSVHEDIPKEKVNRLHNINHYIVSQTNPYVVPFLNEEIEETGLIPFIQDVILKAPMVQVEHFLELVHQHFDLPGLGSIIKKAHAMVSQNYSGDITIHPERNLMNMSKIFANLDPDQATTMMLEGRRATWPKMERIRNTTQISRTFDDCLKRMNESYRYVKR
jgi:TAG lipase/steryl ester hydrolase/phospholipase A2/LPA acyltransferase